MSTTSSSSRRGTTRMSRSPRRQSRRARRRRRQAAGADKRGSARARRACRASRRRPDGVPQPPLGLRSADPSPADREGHSGTFDGMSPASSVGCHRYAVTPGETTSPREGGGVLLDLGTHLVDQALALFGPVGRVYGEVDLRRGGPADDDVFLAIEHASGVRSHLWASAVAGAPGARLSVLGSRAAFVVQEIDGQEDALKAGLRPAGSSDWGAEPESDGDNSFVASTTSRSRRRTAPGRASTSSSVWHSRGRGRCPLIRRMR